MGKFEGLAELINKALATSLDHADIHLPSCQDFVNPRPY